MDNLPVEIIRNIYYYDSTYRDEFERSLMRIKIDFYLYRCCECHKRWQRCYCYCNKCKTCKRYCNQIYYDKDDDMEMDEHPLTSWVQLTI